MRNFAILAGLILSYTVLSVGCHLFDDFEDIEDIEESCPLNSGYPCPCDPSDNKGFCHDNSVCVYWEREGVCSRECTDDPNCSGTNSFGLSGSCQPLVQSETDPNKCVVVCKNNGQEAACPPGLECYDPPKDDVDFGVCVPPAAVVDETENENDTGCKCSKDEIKCLGDDISQCEDGCNWTTYSCFQVCAESGGYSGECSYSEESGHDVCWCDS